jgi:hypothetical protein
VGHLFTEPRQYTFVAVAVGVVAVGATAYAASEQAGAAEDANNANIAQATETNRLNYQLDREHRGAGGQALYPFYAKTATGGKFEPQLFADAYGAYTGVRDASPTMADYKAIAGAVAPGQAGAVRSANDLFSGATQEALLADQEAVSGGRIEAAQVGKQSALEALAATINEIKAINARKGFKSDSFGNNLLSFEARRGAYSAGATGLANAKVANAADVQRIKAGVINARLANPTLPYQVAKAGVATADLPSDSMIERTGRNQQLFAPFRLGQSNFQYAPLPERVPIPSTAGIVAGAIGKTATGVATGLASQPSADASPAPPIGGTGIGADGWRYVNGQRIGAA